MARLPDSPAIAADAAKPAPLRLWSGLAGPTTAPSQRPQTRQEARAALADTPTAHVAIWTRGQPQPVVLPRIEAMKKIERSADYDIIALPLPGTQPSDWRSAIERTTARPELAKWLGRVDESGWQKEEQAKREETKEADRAAREKLRSGFYRMLLGE